MRSFLLLLVLTLVAITSSNAFMPSRPQLKVSKPELEQATPWRTDDKRFLRASGEVDEERGFSDLAAKLKAWLQKFKSWFTKSKPVTAATTKYEKNEVTKAEGLIKKGVMNDVLYQNKISPETYFDALKLDPKLRFVSDSAVARANNPNLEKFLSYTSFYNKSQAGKREVAKAEDLIQKGVTDKVLLKNQISPEAYFEALKLDPKLKLIADSAVARKNNPDLEKFYTYATKYYNSLAGK
ncbi:Neutral ceramidase [Phytophthora nicotianae]|uniref:RxLR effector protein n=1 Tax=Phytophthora nicotianae TaxID=4792 RepID=A0A0W8D1I2_PHYNI|nr:Neutral ceramidase [Phytophthora nicotianae]